MLRNAKPTEGYNIFWGEAGNPQEALSDMIEKIRQAEVDFEVVRGFGGPFLKETEHPKDIWYATQALELRRRS